MIQKCNKEEKGYYGTLTYIACDWIKNYSEGKETTLKKHHDIFSLGCMFIYLICKLSKNNIYMCCPIIFFKPSNITKNKEKNFMKESRKNYNDVAHKNNMRAINVYYLTPNLPRNNNSSSEICNYIMNIIENMVDPDSEKRYQSVDEIIPLLEKFNKFSIIHNIITLDLESYTKSATFIKNSHNIIYCSLDGNFFYFDILKKTSEKLKMDKLNNTQLVAFSLDGLYLACPVINKLSIISAIGIWDTKSGILIKEIPYSRRINSIDFSPDGLSIVSGSPEGFINIWNIESGVCITTLQDIRSNNITLVVFNFDGSHIISCSDKNSLLIWNINSKKIIRELNGHTSPIVSAKFSDDGQRIVCGSTKGFIYIWDTESGKLIKSIVGHSSWVNSVSFSPDRLRILSASLD